MGTAEIKPTEEERQDTEFDLSKGVWWRSGKLSVQSPAPG